MAFGPDTALCLVSWLHCWEDAARGLASNVPTNSVHYEPFALWLRLPTTPAEHLQLNQASAPPPTGGRPWVAAGDETGQLGTRHTYTQLCGTRQSSRCQAGALGMGQAVQSTVGRQQSPYRPVARALATTRPPPGRQRWPECWRLPQPAACGRLQGWVGRVDRRALGAIRSAGQAKVKRVQQHQLQAAPMPLNQQAGFRVHGADRAHEAVVGWWDPLLMRAVPCSTATECGRCERQLDGNREAWSIMVGYGGGGTPAAAGGAPLSAAPPPPPPRRRAASTSSQAHRTPLLLLQHQSCVDQLSSFR